MRRMGINIVVLFAVAVLFGCADDSGTDHGDTDVEAEEDGYRRDNYYYDWRNGISVAIG